MELRSEGATAASRTLVPDARDASLISSLVMDVFVIPIERDRYELYCEDPIFVANIRSPSQPSADTSSPDAGPGTQRPPDGFIHRWRQFIARWRDWFMSLLKAAEHRQYHPDTSDEPRGWLGRAQERMLGWVVERIAEQRLLWNLRGQTAAVAAHPQDMTFEQVMTLVRRVLQRDYERHRRWMIIDGIAFLATFILLGPFFLLVPGVANLPALYFGFRVVGHWLSMRGARQGLDRVSWTGRPCPPLSELRDVAALEPGVREQRILDIASRLRLQHLTTFFERVAVRHA
jgi:hypothetical protein